MTRIKIQQCREHWQQLPPHCKARPTAKHLFAAVEIAERLLSENSKFEAQAITLRINSAPEDPEP